MENLGIPKRFRVIQTRAGAEAFCEELLAQPLVATDSEWYDYTDDKHRAGDGLSLCWTFAYRDVEGQLEVVLLLNVFEAEGLVHCLEPWWVSERNLKVLHNAPVDWHVLANHGVYGRSMHIDTMMADFLYDENREGSHGLKECAEDHLGLTWGDFKTTFGQPKLKKDGTPYKNGGVDVPPLDQWLAEERRRANNPLLVPQKLVRYAGHDAVATLLLYEFYREQLSARPWGRGQTYWDYFIERECTVTKMVERVERRGMPLDIPFLQDMQAKAEADIERLDIEVAKWLGFPLNMKSAPQMQHLLFGEGGYEVKKGKRVLFTIPGYGFPVNDRFRNAPTAAQKAANGGKWVPGSPQASGPAIADIVERIEAGEIDLQYEKESVLAGLKLIRESKAIGTQKSTFLDGLLERHNKGRIHCRMNQAGTTSGRFSTAGPNLQNITTGEKDRYHIREAFVAPEGYFVFCADYAQLEYRILAHFSQDPLLLQAFRDGLDLHSLTAWKAFDNVSAAVLQHFGDLDVLGAEHLDWIAKNFKKERRNSKSVNFGVIYGIQGQGLSKQLGCTEEEAQAMVDAWYSTYSRVRPWQIKTLEQAREKGFIKTVLGRYRHPNMARLNNRNRSIVGEEERTILNAKIQGSAADVAETAMAKVEHDELLWALDYSMIMQEHDSIVGIGPIKHRVQIEERLRVLMESPFDVPLRVPLPVDVSSGVSWGATK